MTAAEAGARRGEVALVTGANKGIGREIARRLAAEGMTVYLGSRDRQRGRSAERELTGQGADVRFIPLDVTDEAQIEAAARRIDEEWGRLDVLVNNAGVVVEWNVPIEDITAEHLRSAYEVNVFGVVSVIQKMLPLLRRAPAARIVNMSSPLGSLSLLSDPGNPISQRHLLAYSSSKAALNALTLLYANALRPMGILVNAANPGLVASDLNTDSPFSRGNRSAEQGADVPVKLALIGPDQPTGTFRGADDGSIEQLVPW